MLLFTACFNRDEPGPSLLNARDFSQLEVGNYWIYHWYEVTPEGSQTNMQLQDTVAIVGDTLIEGRTMYIREGTFLGQPRREILYDSSTHLISYPERIVLFAFDSQVEYTRSFGPEDTPISVGTYRLNSTVERITVPAGRFDCLNFQGTIESLQLDYPHGTRYNDNLYAEGIGLVQLTTQFYSQANDMEMRLAEYRRF